MHWSERNPLCIDFLCSPREDVQQLFRDKDRDHDGYLSFEEFIGQETKIEIAFKAMDRDGDGYISKDEFIKVCKGLTKEQVNAAFNKFDKDGTGKLNYREFCSMMNNRKKSSDRKESSSSTTSKEPDVTEASSSSKDRWLTSLWWSFRSSLHDKTSSCYSTQ